VTEDHAARRAALTAAHGQPVPLPGQAAAAAVLRALGLRDRIHPRDAYAFTYRDQAAAGAWQHATWTRHATPALGTCVTEGGGVIGVYDLRGPQAAAARDAGGSWQFTDPALPDDWTPPRPGGRVG
jgi:hypothetical protein